VCRVWDDKAQIIEKSVFYDLVGFPKQIGLSKYYLHDRESDA
jgi:hypothetical protein